MMMSQPELSKKYDINGGTVSLCCEGLPYEKKPTGKNGYAVKYFNEDDVIVKLNGYYMEMYEKTLAKAEEYRQKALSFQQKR